MRARRPRSQRAPASTSRHQGLHRQPRQPERSEQAAAGERQRAARQLAQLAAPVDGAAVRRRLGRDDLLAEAAGVDHLPQHRLIVEEALRSGLDQETIGLLRPRLAADLVGRLEHDDLEGGAGAPGLGGRLPGGGQPGRPAADDHQAAGPLDAQTSRSASAWTASAWTVSIRVCTASSGVSGSTP